MKFFSSLITLFILASCGKSIDNHAQIPTKKQEKSHLSQAETWTIHSEKALPSAVKVVINELEFINECTGLGRAVFERTKNNGTIRISSFSTFRQEYFDVDILDCRDGSIFYSQNYVDNFLIENPLSGEFAIIIRLRN